MNLPLILALSLAVGLTFPLHLHGKQPDKIQVAIPAHISSTPYLEASDDGRLNGAIVEFARCALRDYPVEFQRAPAKRLQQMLARGTADLMLPIILDKQRSNLEFYRLLPSSKPFLNAYISVITTNKELLKQLSSIEDLNTVRIGAVRGNYLYDILMQTLSNEITSTSYNSQLFKLLLSERLDAAVITAPWPGEQITTFSDQTIHAKTLITTEVSAVFSAQTALQRPKLIDNFNDNIDSCTHHLVLERPE